MMRSASHLKLVSSHQIPPHPAEVSVEDRKWLGDLVRQLLALHDRELHHTAKSQVNNFITRAVGFVGETREYMILCGCLETATTILRTKEHAAAEEMHRIQTEFKRRFERFKPQEN